MYEGKPCSGLDFYKCLFESQEFCAVLGQVTLASGQLEAELIRLLLYKNPERSVQAKPLGILIKLVAKDGHLNDKVIAALKDLSKQRNYLTHNIYSLFSELIDETGLARNNLLDTDVHVYVVKTQQLKEDLLYVTEVVKNAQLKAQ